MRRPTRPTQSQDLPASTNAPASKAGAQGAASDKSPTPTPLAQVGKFYREFKGWMLGLAATGSAALLVPVVVDLPPSAEQQCETAVSVEAAYRERDNLTPAQQRLYGDAVRELDECMQ